MEDLATCSLSNIVGGKIQFDSTIVAVFQTLDELNQSGTPSFPVDYTTNFFITSPYTVGLEATALDTSFSKAPDQISFTGNSLMLDLSAGVRRPDGSVPLVGDIDIFRVYTTAPVPLPGTLAISAIGLLGLGFARRRQV